MMSNSIELAFGLVLVVAILVALGAAATAWGVDSREMLAEDHTR